jgi:hypothetical protein
MVDWCRCAQRHWTQLTWRHQLPTRQLFNDYSLRAGLSDVQDPGSDSALAIMDSDLAALQ